jgi:hypothetical protein
MGKCFCGALHYAVPDEFLYAMLIGGGWTPPRWAWADLDAKLAVGKLSIVGG